MFQTMEGLFWRGVEEFNTRSFFEAHDTWEELWRDTRGDRRLFYQGLIQTAVGFYHLSHGNLRGGCSQLGKALAKLEQYLPAYLGIDTQHLVQGVRWCLHEAEGMKSGEAESLSESAIPQIRVMER